LERLPCLCENHAEDFRTQRFAERAQWQWVENDCFTQAAGAWSTIGVTCEDLANQVAVNGGIEDRYEGILTAWIGNGYDRDALRGELAI
jgi:hypothetical protein